MAGGNTPSDRISQKGKQKNIKGGKGLAQAIRDPRTILDGRAGATDEAP